MTTPAVVEKQVVDISFSGGLNESTRAESLDWNKYLKVADNVDFGDDGVIRPRTGLQKVAAVADVSGTEFYRALSTGTGVLALGAGTNARISAYHLNESAAAVSGSLSPKGPIGEYAVYPKQLGSINGDTPKPIGACYTTKYDISVLTPNSQDYFVYFQDKQSGNIVASYTIGVGVSTAAIALVAGRYLHVYAGVVGSAKVYAFDTLSLPTSVPSGVLCTSGTFVVAAVANASTSVVLMSNGNMSRFTTAATPVESATGAVVLADATTKYVHDMDTDGTNFYVVGRQKYDAGSGYFAYGCMKVLDASFTTTRTVVDATALGTATDATETRFSIAVNLSSAAKVVAYYKTVVGTFTLPCARVCDVSSSATSFAHIQTLPCWGEVSSPFWNNTMQAFYVVMTQLVDQGYGEGHDVTKPGGATALVELSNLSWALAAPPGGYHIASVLDAYLDYVGNNSVTGGGITNPQKIYSDDSGKTLAITSVQRIGAQSYGSEFRTMKLNDVRRTVCATDVISGGKTSLYDGVCVAELGVLETPWITAVDGGAGTGVEAGTRSYTAFFEAVDATGRRHISRSANPFVYDMAAPKNVNISISYPNVSDHVSYNVGSSGVGTSSANAYNFKYHVYRTVANSATNAGTQYYRIASGQVQGTASTAAVISFADSVSDANLILNDLMFRQPGTQGTSLDHYHTPASSCVVRHKDRVFIARGSDVYFSSFDVFGEAPWFNPAFSFKVPGGIGDITALATFDGTLVVFKVNGIWLVDGDGPAENGGNGTEFSPPRRIPTELGCVDARTLISTNDGLLFRSMQGIQRLTRKLTVDWIGQRVFRTVDANPYNGGAAFDVLTGRCVWLIGSTEGTYPGQLSSSGTGYAVVYDTTNDSWSRYKLLSSAGAGKAFQDVCFAEVGSVAQSITTGGRLVYLDTANMYMEALGYDYISSNSFIPVTLETGWIKSQSKQERIRVSDFTIAAYRNADCTVATSYAANYSPTYVSVKTWTPATTGALTIVQLETQPPVEAVQSMSFKIVTSDPTPTSFGAGTQMDIFGLTVRVGLRGGGAKLPAAQKG